MKKIIILTIIGLLIYINGISQQQATIHDVVTVTLPKNVEKLTKEKLASLKPKMEKPSPVVYENSSGESFKGENYVIQLNAAPVVPSPGFLEQRKREMDSLFSLAQPQVYDTSIKRFQNHSVVITNYEYVGDEKGYFIFKSYNKTGDNVLVGTIEYDKGKKEDAEKALDEIIKGIKLNKS